MTIHGIFIGPTNATGFRYVAMRSPKGCPKLLWFRVPTDTRIREQRIDPNYVPARIKERAYDVLGTT